LDDHRLELEEGLEGTHYGSCFKSETECLRDALRQGVQALKAQRSVFGILEKRKDSILQSAGLLEEEYERLSRGELELRIRSQWRKVEQPAWKVAAGIH